MDGFDHFCGKHRLFSIHQVLEEVYRDVVVGWEIYAYVSREEVIDLALAAVLSRELLRGYLSILLSLSIDRLHRRVTTVHL